MAAPNPISVNIVANPVNTMIITTSPKSCGDRRRVRITDVTKYASWAPIRVTLLHATPVRILLSNSSTFSPLCVAHIENLQFGAYRDSVAWVRPSQLKKRAPDNSSLPFDI